MSEPNSVTAWHGLGNALRALGRRQEAVACYRTALNERQWARTRRLGRPPLPDEATVRRDLEIAMNLR